MILKITPNTGDAIHTQERKNLEDGFHRAMLDVYDRCAEHGYKPVQFREMVNQYGGVVTAHKLLKDPETSGFAKLTLLGLQKYSTEALVLLAQFRPLFDADEIETATKRVADIGPVGIL
jgi:hypothetical protein